MGARTLDDIYEILEKVADKLPEKKKEKSEEDKKPEKHKAPLGDFIRSLRNFTNSGVLNVTANAKDLIAKLSDLVQAGFQFGDKIQSIFDRFNGRTPTVSPSISVPTGTAASSAPHVPNATSQGVSVHQIHIPKPSPRIIGEHLPKLGPVIESRALPAASDAVATLGSRGALALAGGAGGGGIATIGGGSLAAAGAGGGLASAGAAGGAGAAGAGGAGAAGAGVAALASNPVGWVIGAIVAIAAVTAALIAIPVLLKNWGNSLLESQRDIAEWSGSMAKVFAQKDVAEGLRKQRVGEATAGSAGRLNNALQHISDVFEPFVVLLTNFFNNVLAGAIEFFATIGEGIIAALNMQIRILNLIVKTISFGQIEALLGEIKINTEKDGKASDWQNFLLDALKANQNFRGGPARPPSFMPHLA